MEYRGSKLVMFTNNITVKEQRVDGHRCVNLAHLRYALTGFEINSQIRIPSNHLNTSRRLYTSLPINLNPWFLTGFCDGESNFFVRIVKSNSVKVGWAVQPLFFFFEIGFTPSDQKRFLFAKKYPSLLRCRRNLL